MPSLIRFFLLCVVGLTAAKHAVAQSSNEGEILRGQPVQLFDGKSLEGWSQADGSPSPNWIVKEGLLQCEKRGGDLYHAHWYRDFELKFTWKIDEGGNSGVKYRVRKYGNRNLGCEYQIFDDRKDLFGKQSTGALYALYEPAKNKTSRPLGQWNDSMILVCGNRIEHWLNGELVVQADVGSDQWLNRVAQSKFSEAEHFGQNREGRILLQDHGKPVWFSKIELVPLSCDR